MKKTYEVSITFDDGNSLVGARVRNFIGSDGGLANLGEVVLGAVSQLNGQNVRHSGKVICDMASLLGARLQSNESEEGRAFNHELKQFADAANRFARYLRTTNPSE